MQLEYFDTDSLTLPRLQTFCSMGNHRKQLLFTRWHYCC